MLKIEGLNAEIDGKPILNGIDLEVPTGELHAIMGPNGSGKSTLSYVLAGREGYEVTGGSATFDGHDLLSMEPEERAAAGLFLAFQYPVAVAGVSVANFLRAAINAHRSEEGKDTRQTAIPVAEYRKLLNEKMKMLDMAPEFARRYLNEGFSGGEKKRNEILQMAMLEPDMAILDETDSGLDIDALRIVAEGVNKFAGPDMGVLIITHYQRILHMVKPDQVHVMYQGRIVKQGGPELVGVLEEKGYGWIKEEVEAGAAA